MLLNRGRFNCSVNHCMGCPIADAIKINNGRDCLAALSSNTLDGVRAFVQNSPASQLNVKPI